MKHGIIALGSFCVGFMRSMVVLFPKAVVGCMVSRVICLIFQKTCMFVSISLSSVFLSAAADELQADADQLGVDADQMMTDAMQLPEQVETSVCGWWQNMMMRWNGMSSMHKVILVGLVGLMVFWVVCRLMKKCKGSCACGCVGGCRCK